MVEQLIGSEELKKSLPYGAMSDMASVFGCSLNWIAKVVQGSATSKQKILECAVALKEVQEEKQEEIAKILDEYKL